MTPDLINAMFETAGGTMVWLNVLAIRRDQQVKGIEPWAIALMTLWGCWNLWYYPHLGQWASFWGGLVIVSANVAGLWLAWVYRTCPVCEDRGFVIPLDHSVTVVPEQVRPDLPMAPLCPRCVTIMRPGSRLARW